MPYPSETMLTGTYGIVTSLVNPRVLVPFTQRPPGLAWSKFWSFPITPIFKELIYIIYLTVRGCKSNFSHCFWNSSRTAQQAKGWAQEEEYSMLASEMQWGTPLAWETFIIRMTPVLVGNSFKLGRCEHLFCYYILLERKKFHLFRTSWLFCWLGDPVEEVGQSK